MRAQRGTGQPVPLLIGDNMNGILDAMDTIAAISTPRGEGGIGIVRVSGARAKEILQALFHSPKEQEKALENRRLTYGVIRNPQSGEEVDEVLAVWMRAPATYTGEDVVEIHCHGGNVPLTQTLSLVLDQGARLADVGEFTKRAFLCGRIDLSQAEAVIDVIRAKTERSHAAAISQLRGELAAKIRALREELLEILMLIAVSLDYSEEETLEESFAEVLGLNKKSDGATIIKARNARVYSILEEVEDLLSTAESGRILREGLSVAIAGKPNVGKSSIMNRLLRESRAIVTELPGTTRDTIEETLNLRGIPINLVDTAGVRATTDAIEGMGIERSREAFQNADLVLFVLDASRELCEEDIQIAKMLAGGAVMVLENKSDLERKIENAQIHVLVATLAKAEKGRKKEDVPITMRISAATGEGFETLENELERFVFGTAEAPRGGMVANVRQKNLLQQAAEALREAYAALESGEPEELADVDLRRAYERLGEIIGETVSEDVLDAVFSRFCLGK